MFYSLLSVLNFATFSTYTALGNVLTPRKVFTVISLFTVMRLFFYHLVVLGALGISEVWVSLKRIEVSVCVCVRVRVHAYIYVHARVCACVRVRAYMYVHARVYVHVHGIVIAFILFIQKLLLLPELRGTAIAGTSSDPVKTTSRSCSPTLELINEESITYSRHKSFSSSTRISINGLMASWTHVRPRRFSNQFLF